MSRQSLATAASVTLPSTPAISGVIPSIELRSLSKSIHRFLHRFHHRTLRLHPPVSSSVPYVLKRGIAFPIHRPSVSKSSPTSNLASSPKHFARIVFRQPLFTSSTPKIFVLRIQVLYLKSSPAPFFFQASSRFASSRHIDSDRRRGDVSKKGDRGVLGKEGMQSQT